MTSNLAPAEDKATDRDVSYHGKNHGESGRDKVLHRLLGFLHKDSTASDPVRGGLIQAEGDPALWTQHAKGTSGQFFKEGADEADWANIVHTDVSDWDEAAQDSIGLAIIPTTTITPTYNDGANQFTWDVNKTLDSTYITDFTEAAQDAVGAALTDTATIDTTYNDAGNQMTFDVKKALDTTWLTDVIKAETAQQQLTSNSTAMQNITTAKIALGTNQIWRFSATILYNCTAAADFQFQFTVPASGFLRFSSMQYQDAAATPTFVQGAAAATSVNALGDTTIRAIEVAGTVSTAGTAGDLQLQAAQNTATAENVDVVIAGTNIVAVRVL